MAGEGESEYQKRIDAGFTPTETEGWKQQRLAAQRAAGFTQPDIDEYWGDHRPPGPATKTLGNLVKQNWDEDQAHVADPNNWFEMLAAGWNMSATSLMRHAPQVIAPKDAGIVAQIMEGAGQLAGDAPSALLGWGLGTAGGAALTSETGPGAIGGAALGGGAGAYMLPEAIRQVQMDAYRNGEFLDAKDTLKRASSMAWNTAKAGIIGFGSTIIGGPVGSKVLSATGSKLIAGTAEATAFTGASEAISAGLDGRLPDREHAITGVVLAIGTLGLMKGGQHLVEYVGATRRPVLTPAGEKVAENMEDIYVKTGVPPWEQAERAKTDPGLRQDIFAKDANGQPGHGFDQEQPPPFRTNAHKVADEHELDVESIYGEAMQNAAKKAKPADESGLTDLIGHLEGSEAAAARWNRNNPGQPSITADDVVSPAGAIGRYQVMPGTAKQYGFDPSRLREPAYNKRVAGAILNDLKTRYRNPDGSVDMEAVLIAYNAGPGRAQLFRADGRDYSRLPPETQRYLERAEGATGGLGGGKPPALPPEPPEGGIGGDEFSGFTADFLKEHENDFVSEKPKPAWRQRLKDWSDRARYEISELSVPARLDKEFGVPENQVGLTDLFRQVYGSVGRAYSMLKYGRVALGKDAGGKLEYKILDNNAVIPAFENAARKNEGDIGEFRALLQARRTLELDARGKKTTMDVLEARARVAAAGPKYDAEIKMLRAANDGKIDFRVAAGLLSKEAGAAIKAKNREWFPQKVDKSQPSFMGTGKGFTPRNTIKKAGGHKQKILDPVEQTIKSFYDAAADGDKNRAVGLLAYALGATERGRIASGPKGTALAVPEKGGELAEYHPAEDELYNAEGDFVSLDGRKSDMWGSGNEICWYENGRRRTMELDDPLIAEFVRGVSPLATDNVLSVFKWFAKIKRSGITDMPDFVLRALIKDSVFAAITSRYGGKPLLNTFEGIFHVMKADEFYREAIVNGSFGMALADMDANVIGRHMHEINASTGFLAQTTNTVKHPIEAMQLLSQKMDMVNRVGVYGRAKRAGVGGLKAGVEGRKATLDFQEKCGSQVLNALSGIVPFFRPAVRGDITSATAFKNAAIGTSIKAAIYIGIPTIIMYAMNVIQDENDDTLPEDQKFQNLPRWVKDNYLVLPSAGGERTKLPWPNEFGVLFSGGINRTLDAAYLKDPKAFKEWAKDIFDGMTPPVFPPAVQPIIEQMANHNYFTGRPLIPASLEGLSGYMQYTPATTEPAKALANILGEPGLNIADVSPVVIDNYVREWTGGMGVAAFRVLGTPFTPANTPGQLADNPFVGSFFVRHPGMNAQPIQDFYDEIDRLKTAHKDFARAVELGDESLIDLTGSKPEAFLSLYDMQQALTTQRAFVEGVTNDPEMTKAEKRQFIDDAFSAMVMEAKAGMDAIRSLNEDTSPAEAATPEPEPEEPLSPPTEEETEEEQPE